MNNTNEAAIIDGPEDVLNSNDEYKPNTTAVSYTHLTLPTSG